MVDSATSHHAIGIRLLHIIVGLRNMGACHHELVQHRVVRIAQSSRSVEADSIFGKQGKVHAELCRTRCQRPERRCLRALWRSQQPFCKSDEYAGYIPGTHNLLLTLSHSLVNNLGVGLAIALCSAGWHSQRPSLLEGSVTRAKRL